jgi:hypothetical protein
MISLRRVPEDEEASMFKTKPIEAGDWRTVEWFFNATGHAWFGLPVGAEIKVRYGVGWFGKDRQKQRLDGQSAKKLEVGGWSVTRARFQVKVQRTTEVTYAVFPGPSAGTSPPDGIITIPL